MLTRHLRHLRNHLAHGHFWSPTPSNRRQQRYHIFQTPSKDGVFCGDLRRLPMKYLPKNAAFVDLPMRAVDDLQCTPFRRTHPTWSSSSLLSHHLGCCHANKTHHITYNDSVLLYLPTAGLGDLHCNRLRSKTPHNHSPLWGGEGTLQWAASASHVSQTLS